MIMSRTRRDFTRSLYRAPNDFLVGMTNDGTSRAWRFQDLHQNPLVNDKFADQFVVLSFDSESGTPFVFERSVDGMQLTFSRRDEVYVDDQTGSVWDLRSGTAIQGPRKGTQLNPLVGITSFKSAWEMFYPTSTYWSPERNP